MSQQTAPRATLSIRYFAWQDIPNTPETDERQMIVECLRYTDGHTVTKPTLKVMPNVTEAARVVADLNRRFSFSPSFKGSEV